MALVIHFQNFATPDFPKLLERLKGAQMTRQDTLIAAGAEIGLALELIIMPAIAQLIANSREIRGIKEVSKNRGAGVLDVLEQE